MSGVVSKTEIIPAFGSFRAPSGNFCMLIETGAPVRVRFQRKGSSFGAEGVRGGYVQGLVEEWERCEIYGTAGTSVTYLIGYAEVREDFTDYRRTVGVFQEQLPQTIADSADVDVGGVAGPVVVAPANPGRARVTVKVRGDAAVSIRVGGATVTAARGVQLGGGESQTFAGPGAVYAIRESAGVAAVTLNEELL